MDEKIIDNFVFKHLSFMDYDLLKTKINGRKVYIWGADTKGQRIYEILNNNGICVTGYLDSTIKRVKSIEVEKPDIVIRKGSSIKNFIIVSMKLLHQKEVLERFRSADFSNDDYYYPYFNLSFAWNALRQDTIGNDLLKLKRGEALADSVERNKIFFVLYGGHIGEEALSVSWLGAFKREHFIKEITVITSVKYEVLTILYQDIIDEVIVWDEERLSDLVYYLGRPSCLHINFVGAGWVWIPMEREIPFPMNQIIYKTSHLGLPYYINSEYYDIPMNDELLHELGKEPEKIVILMPYAKSASSLPNVFWEKTVKRLLELGFKCFTNVNGAEEKPIIGTFPLRLNLKDIITAVKYSGVTISARSGLIDLLALGRIENMLVLHRTRNVSEWNYAKVNSLYVNGEHSTLYSNSIYDFDRENVEVFIEKIIEKAMKICEARNE